MSAGLTTNGLTQLVNPAGDIVRSTTAQQIGGTPINFAKVDIVFNGPVKDGETWALTINGTAIDSFVASAGVLSGAVASWFAGRTMPSSVASAVVNGNVLTLTAANPSAGLTRRRVDHRPQPGRHGDARRHPGRLTDRRRRLQQGHVPHCRCRRSAR